MTDSDERLREAVEVMGRHKLSSSWREHDAEKFVQSIAAAAAALVREALDEILEIDDLADGAADLGTVLPERYVLRLNGYQAVNLLAVLKAVVGIPHLKPLDTGDWLKEVVTKLCDLDAHLYGSGPNRTLEEIRGSFVMAECESNTMVATTLMRVRQVVTDEAVTAAVAYLKQVDEAKGSGG